MSADFPNLFKPIRIGPFTIKNRIAVAPHGVYYADNGRLTQRYVDYEAEKAKGGAGLIIMSYGISDPLGPEGRLVSVWRKENVPLFRDLVEQVHSYDCRILFQYGENNYHSGLGPTDFPHTGLSSAATRAMTPADIRRMMDNYRACAETLMEAGLDGVEMHGHGDLFSDFLSPTMNRRTDEYGGSLDNRLRFILEAAETIRGVLGGGRILGARLSVDDQLPGSVPLESGVEIARRLADSGFLDYLNIDTVVEPQLLPHLIAPMYVEEGHQRYAAAAVKAVVKNLPIFAVGRITGPAMAEAVLADGQADVVTMARALIADPELPNKAREGRLADIRPCLGDNQECIGRVIQGLDMGCTVNPAAGREAERGIGRLGPAGRSKRVMVIGGGPAGLEAARIAALRGHEVSLYEKEGELGGQVRLARRLPGRTDIGRFVPWHQRQLEQLQVKVRLGMEVSLALVEEAGPDAVVLAAGARWLKTGFNGLNYLEVSGWRQPNVLSLEDVVGGGAEIGARVMILDAKGFVEAPGVAEMLADRGMQVEIVTPFPQLGVNELKTTFQWLHIMPRLLRRKVKITPDTWLESVDGRTATTVNLHTREQTKIEVDTVVIISGRSANDGLYAGLRASGVETHRVGDCASPLNIGKAIGDGHRAALAL